ncbi:MAG: thioredoxin domain-containing protein [Mariprofundaceae bacterium]|nr:thioredoxin domain-containing protein [Mariprofundaceae bacterium]
MPDQHTASRSLPANHLAGQSSPYLLQHAHNPVNWYPWVEEAFARARREDKPILLSIGYATCHWCHVMEEESFSDAEVGAVLNEHVIAIKVDREERPDIDQVYMQAAQMMNGGGGWPLNILMTPDKRPFYAGTYLPKHGRFGRIGLIELVERVSQLWHGNRDKLLLPAGQLADAMAAMHRSDTSGEVDSGLAARAFTQLQTSFDAQNGGFGDAPKFPTAHRLLFLLRYWRHSGDASALDMVKQSLHAMRAGGVFDQLGYGFHRYSTDDHWLLPHFEKMLYDQAMLMMAYSEAAQATGEAAFAATAKEIAAYVLGEMQAPEGGFYSADDADSEGEEGRFYVWRLDELKSVLGEADAALAAQAFGVEQAGNVRDEASGKQTGVNVLHLAVPPANAEAAAQLERIRIRLLAARNSRIHPFRDDKVLTDWNGLMIAALAITGRSLDAPQLTAAARKSADFLLATMRNDKGRLLHRWRAGKAGLDAHLDDYAFLVWGLIELYQSSFEPAYLQAAMGLNEDMLTMFSAPGGGFYFTAEDAEVLLVRPVDAFDDAIPSGNAVAMFNLLRLARMSGKAGLEARAARIPAAFAHDLNRAPSAFIWLDAAMQLAEAEDVEVVLAGDRSSPEAKDWLQALNSRYQPERVVLWNQPALKSVAPFAVDYLPVDGKLTAYVCRGGQCNLPVTRIKDMLKQLDETKDRTSEN